MEKLESLYIANGNANGLVIMEYSLVVPENTESPYESEIPVQIYTQENGYENSEDENSYRLIFPYLL